MSATRNLLVMLILALLAAVPWAFDSYVVGLVMRILVWGLFAASFDLLFGYVGVLSLGHSVYFGLGAYGATGLVLAQGPAIALPLLAALGVGTAVAAVIGLVAVRTGRHGVIILTALSALIAYLLAQNQADLTGGDDGLTLPAMPLSIGDWSAGCAVPGPAYLLVLGVVALSVLGLHALVRTPLGTALRATRENEDQAAALGYDTTRLKWLAFTISGAGAALAGGLHALTNCYVSTGLFHWLVSADALIWTLFGGAGTLVGPLVGTGALVAIREALSGVWANGYPILIGIVLLLVIRYLPGGLVGLLRRRSP